MEKLSRVKKFENYRREIDAMELNPDKLVGDKDEAVFNASFLKKMNVESEYVPEREKKEETKEHDFFNTDTFKNEYMDDFIKEVKQYNIERGLLENENTEIDILNQLRSKPSRRIELTQELRKSQSESSLPSLENDTVNQSKQEIARQIQELLNEENEDSNNGFSVKKVELPQEETTQIPIISNNQGLYEQQRIEDESFQRRISEETQQIRVQLSKNEEEINGLNQGVEKTHKLLNIALAILVMAFIAVIGVMVYLILKAGGKV